MVLGSQLANSNRSLTVFKVHCENELTDEFCEIRSL